MENLPLITFGKANCFNAPMGAHGLEGFYTWQVYHFQQIVNGSKIHFRLFPDPDSGYYETCSVTIFNRFFKIRP